MQKCSIMLGAASLALALGAGIATAGGKPPAVDLVNCATLNDAPYVSNACNIELVTLCSAIDVANASSLGDRDRDTMVSKVIGAAIKIDEEKFDDAYGKLYEIELKLDSLVNAPKPKITEADAGSITDELIPAQGCVDAL